MREASPESSRRCRTRIPCELAGAGPGWLDCSVRPARKNNKLRGKVVLRFDLVASVDTSSCWCWVAICVFYAQLSPASHLQASPGTAGGGTTLITAQLTSGLVGSPRDGAGGMIEGSTFRYIEG